MKFIERATTKKQIIKIIENSEIVYQEAFDCLKPSRNVYYHYEFYHLHMTRSEQTVSLQEIKQSFISFDGYINQLTNLKTQLKSLLKDEKLKNKFSAKYKTIKSYFKVLYSDVTNLINSIREIPEFRTFPELKLILQELEQKMVKLQKIAKIEEEQSTILTIK